MDFCEDIKEQYKEMRDEFMAGLEDRKYLTIEQVRAKGLQVNLSAVPYSLLHAVLISYSSSAEYDANVCPSACCSNVMWIIFHREQHGVIIKQQQARVTQPSFCMRSEYQLHVETHQECHTCTEDLR